ncbi:low affinity iron permease family protein [Ciceribacter sp. RN22]|uniref:low affinity iron permease family protein n=1 Tax=Ciceribacter sp. RN22 TaxID=2954932 RepID=UPI0027E21B0B|nr:low affinity iron permease family protein [Ciceribacter sp. RN22]
MKSVSSRGTRAIRTRRDEIILTRRAENRFIGIENLDEEELKRLNALLGDAAKRDRHAREAALSAHRDGSEAGRDGTEEAPPLEPAAPR